MREIKFRIYDKKLKKWIGLDFYKDLGAITVENDGILTLGSAYRFSQSMMIVPECFEVMQYTGLKDKNGKEIYEGDIVKVPVKRHSTSNWWQDTNINHGHCGDFVYKKVKYFNYVNNFRDNLSGFDLIDLPITKKQKEEISKPRGKERTKQCVDDINYTFNELEIIGNIYENPELLGEN